MNPGSWFSKKDKKGIIKIVVVHSHSGGKKTFDHLAKHWNDYGSTKLVITHQRDFTLDSLVKASPDIIICSDPAGAPFVNERSLTPLHILICQH
jgi:hypothetical protein